MPSNVTLANVTAHEGPISCCTSQGYVELKQYHRAKHGGSQTRHLHDLTLQMKLEQLHTLFSLGTTANKSNSFLQDSE